MASSEGTDASKSALEASYLRLSAKITPTYQKRLDTEVISHLTSLPLWACASTVLLHPDAASGVRMSTVARRALDQGKRVGVSVAVQSCEDSLKEADKSLDFVEIDDPEVLSKPFDVRMVPQHSFCVGEGETLSFSCEDLLGSVCIVPGLVFDEKGYRVGTDGGAYDRFLKFYPGQKLALVYAMQVSGALLPHASGEVAVDYLVSDGFVWSCHHGSQH
jgi:5-formyltetrahydrofolate cyclo-ligase